MNRSRSTALVLLLLAAGLGWGIYRLFELRFAGGDIYPPYSTFRADPLGARALFEAFVLLPDRQSQRLLDDLNRLDTGRDTTLFVLGVDAGLDDVEESDAKDLERFMHEGGRVVMTFFPTAAKPYSVEWRERRRSTNSPLTRIRSWRPRQPADEPAPREKKSVQKVGANSGDGTNSMVAPGKAVTNAPASKVKAKKADDEERSSINVASLREQWGFAVDYEKLDSDADGITEPATVRRNNSVALLPSRLDWHSAAFFKTTNVAWRPMYVRGSRPVLMERAFGRGSLVLATDSYFASNEALRKSRQTALLAWLAGNNPRLVFDETHLGVESKAGIATLARRYRLHGLFASLLLLAVLFVWKNAAGLVPVHPDAGIAEVVTGKESAAGFVNLLRRSIAPRDLLALCFAEWTKTFRRTHGDTSARIERMKAVVETRAETPVDAFRELSRIVSEKNL